MSTKVSWIPNNPAFHLEEASIEQCQGRCPRGAWHSEPASLRGLLLPPLFTATVAAAMCCADQLVKPSVAACRTLLNPQDTRKNSYHSLPSMFNRHSHAQMHTHTCTYIRTYFKSFCE